MTDRPCNRFCASWPSCACGPDQSTTEPARPAEKEVMQIEAVQDGRQHAVAPPPVSPDAGGEQPAVPLPNVAATITSWSNGSYWRNYRVEWHNDSMDVHQQLVCIEDAIAYGEACAAHWKARAEAAEAKIAEMGG